jgi:hypothetical protein
MVEYTCLNKILEEMRVFMASPKIFVSSTCYDLKQIRQDIEGFIKYYGYEAILSERHSIPYNVKDDLESDCYNEISSCDMLVGIVGGVFGSESLDKSGDSISMKEMKKAIEDNKQVYIFIDRNVNTEFNTYSRNVGKDIKYAFVDDTKIFTFIEFLKSKNNIIINDFSTADDIVTCLRSQWAGLFQTYLYNREQLRQNEGLLTLKKVIESLLEVSSKLENNTDSIIQSSDAFFAKASLSRLTYSASVSAISSVLLGANRGTLLFRTLSEIDNYIQKCLGYEPSLFGENHEYVKGDLKLYIDKKFLFDANKQLIYRTTKELKDYEEKNKHSFIYIENTSGDFPDIDDDDGDLPF